MDVEPENNLLITDLDDLNCLDLDMKLAEDILTTRPLVHAKLARAAERSMMALSRTFTAHNGLMVPLGILVADPAVALAVFARADLHPLRGLY